MTTRRLALFAVAVACTACDGPPTQPSPPAQRSLSGVVFQTTSQGRQPVSGVRVLITCDHYATYACDPVEVTSDATGRYSFSDVRQFGVTQVVVPAQPTGLFQACAVHPTIWGETTEDIELVQAGAPPTTARSPTLSGVVFEDTATGRRPVSDLHIGFQSLAQSTDSHDAATRTDSDGRYRLCNLQAGFPGLVWVSCGSAADQKLLTQIDIRGDTPLDVDVTSILKGC